MDERVAALPSTPPGRCSAPQRRDVVTEGWTKGLGWGESIHPRLLEFKSGLEFFRHETLPHNIVPTLDFADSLCRSYRACHSAGSLNHRPRVEFQGKSPGNSERESLQRNCSLASILHPSMIRTSPSNTIHRRATTQWTSNASSSSWRFPSVASRARGAGGARRGARIGGGGTGHAVVVASAFPPSRESHVLQHVLELQLCPVQLLAGRG